MDLPSYTPPEGMEPFVAIWKEKLKQGLDDRGKSFDKDAQLAEKFYEGPHKFLYQPGEEGSITDGQPPSFKITFNKTAELVDLFGPILYHRNPVRTVTPKLHWTPPAGLEGPPPVMGGMAQQMQGMQPDPNAQAMNRTLDNARQQARADLLSRYLNYTPNELNLKEEMRLTVDDALVAGRGCMFTEFYVPPQSQQRLVGSFWCSWKDVIIDPDVKRPADAKWIARRHIVPAWQEERDRGLPEGYLKGVMESTDAKAAVESGALNKDKKASKTSDMIVVWEIWSKMGMGFRLKREQVDTALGSIGKIMEVFGDYVYLRICPGCPFPLNINPKWVPILTNITEEATEAFINPPPEPPPELVQAALAAGLPPPGLPPEIQEQVDTLKQAKMAVVWPLPLWIDGEWPVEFLDFHPRTNCAWPRSHLKSAQGEQEFLDWGYSMLATKMRTTCRDFIALKAGIDQDVEDAIKKGDDLTILRLGTMNESVGDLVEFLQHPPMNNDNFKILQAIEHNYEKRTGLSEAMYGMASTQPRSAAESQIKGQATQIRPDDMAERVEYFSTKLARKEAIIARLFLRGEDVAQIVGPEGAQFWDQEVATNDFLTVCREFDYRIESSSARKPNKDLDVANTAEGAQFLLPVLQSLFQMGVRQPLFAYIEEWAKARDMDISKFITPEILAMLTAPPPPQGQPAPAEGQQQPAPAEGGQQPQPEQQAQQPQPGPTPDDMAALDQRLAQMERVMSSMAQAIQALALKPEAPPPSPAVIPMPAPPQPRVRAKQQKVNYGPDGESIDTIDTHLIYEDEVA